MSLSASRNGNVIAVTRLIQDFNQENINKFKQHLFEQLNCSKESQFICTALKALSSQLTAESSSILKEKATTIAETQKSSNILQYPCTKRQ